jgi:hypothetical protein
VDEPDQPTFRSASDDNSAALRQVADEAGPCTIYYGDAGRVREGFAIALGLLGFGRMTGDAASTPPEKGE